MLDSDSSAVTSSVDESLPDAFDFDYAYSSPFKMCLLPYGGEVDH